MNSWKVPIESLIDHIKTAIDVDPWAKEMAEELLKAQPKIVRCKDCKHLEHLAWLDEKNGKECYVCRKHSFTGMRSLDWFCADAERGKRMIDIEKLRKGLEICSANAECYNCPYYPKAECFCQIGRDSLELLNDYERLAALHVDLLDKVEALLKTLKEARECTE